jgi:hypothetical protein
VFYPGKEIAIISSPSPQATVTVSNEPSAERGIEGERLVGFAANDSKRRCGGAVGY